MAKIPFTLDAWLKDKSQKVETRDGRIVHNIWPVKEQLIFNGKRAEVCALIDGEEDALLFFEGGKYLPVDSENPFDLFIVTPEAELSEFEKKLSDVVGYAISLSVAEPKKPASEFVKEHAAELLFLAREEAIAGEREKPAIVWRRVDKSPDFKKLNLVAAEIGVNFYKCLQKEGIVVGMRSGIISTSPNLSKVLGDSYYLTLEDLFAIPKEDGKDQSAESEDESTTKKLSKSEVSDILIREQAICEDALDTFGIEHQVDKCIEECAELINALEKYRRGRALPPEVVTEIADVLITCAQMSIVFGREAVVHEQARKLKRLEKRIEKAKNRAKSGDKEIAE